MGRAEFREFMDKQIMIIKKYREEYQKVNLNCDSNECVLDWIKKNAKKFKEDWEKLKSE